MKKKKLQHSKLMFNVLLVNGILWVWACFALAYFNRPKIAERLAIASVTTILGSFVTLCTKSYKETKQEHIQALEEHKFTSFLNDVNEFADDDSIQEVMGETMEAENVQEEDDDV